jgi:hypothetical protein
MLPEEGDQNLSLIQRELIKEYAVAATEDICNGAIAHLMASKHTLAGEDSGLVNTWEEICVQLQGDESCYWDAYESAMRDSVLAGLFQLKTRDLHAIWLQTDAGWDWHYDVENGSMQSTTIPYSEDDVVAYQVEKLKLAALDFKNARIEAYLRTEFD